jgi:uncharacterized damage-inducible protein DinB
MLVAVRKCHNYLEKLLSFKEHFQLMAAYNRRMNEQIYQVSNKLEKEELQRDAGAFFGSVLGSLNHILVGDLLWLSRFGSHNNDYVTLIKLSEYPKPQKLSDILYSEFSELFKARKEIDILIQSWVKNETKETHFEQNLTYSNSKGIASSRNFGELVSHFFNHQTHHRGQISTLLYQFGYDVGITDFLIDIPDKQT